MSTNAAGVVGVNEICAWVASTWVAVCVKSGDVTGLITYAALTTGESVSPSLTPMALIVSLVATLIGPPYTVEEADGVDPSVV